MKKKTKSLQINFAGVVLSNVESKVPSFDRGGSVLPRTLPERRCLTNCSVCFWQYLAFLELFAHLVTVANRKSLDCRTVRMRCIRQSRDCPRAILCCAKNLQVLRSGCRNRRLSWLMSCPTVDSARVATGREVKSPSSAWKETVMQETASAPFVATPAAAAAQATKQEVINLTIFVRRPLGREIVLLRVFSVGDPLVQWCCPRFYYRICVCKPLPVRAVATLLKHTGKRHNQVRWFVSSLLQSTISPKLTCRFGAFGEKRESRFLFMLMQEISYSPVWAVSTWREKRNAAWLSFMQNSASDSRL